jgi:hypothetical protein
MNAARAGRLVDHPEPRRTDQPHRLIVVENSRLSLSARQPPSSPNRRHAW